MATVGKPSTGVFAMDNDFDTSKEDNYLDAVAATIDGIEFSGRDLAEDDSDK